MQFMAGAQVRVRARMLLPCEADDSVLTPYVLTASLAPSCPNEIG